MTMAQDPDKKAARLAAGQHGLITWHQARFRAGLTERQIHERVRSGRWRRIQRRVYEVGGSTPSWAASALAVQRCARTETVKVVRGRTALDERDDAVLAGASAVWLRGCTRLGHPERHDIVVGRLRAPTVTGAIVRRTRALPAVDVDCVDGIPTLALPRLLVDLCVQLADTDFVAVLDDLLAGAEPHVRAEVHARALALRNGRPGVDRLVALTAPDAAEIFWSWLERRSAGLSDAAGLPPAAWNCEVRDAAGRLIGIGDAVWEDLGVVVELDGLRFHSTPTQRRRDAAKDRQLTVEGWKVLRFTWLDIVETPDDVVAQVRAALGSGR